MNGSEAQLPLPKRLLAAIFSLVLVVGLVPVCAWAEGEDEQPNNDAALEQTDEQDTDGSGDSDDVASDQGEAVEDNESAENNDSSIQNNVEEEPATVFDEDGIAVASLGDNIEAVDRGTVELWYSELPDKSEIYSKLYDTYEPFLKVTFSLKNVEGKTTEILSTAEGPFTPHNFGKAAYTVTWPIFGKGSLDLYENYSVSSPQDPDSYATYDGSEHRWEPVVEAAKNPNFSSSDYTVTYYRNGIETTDCKSAGTITVKIQGNGDYSYIDEERSYTIRQATDLHFVKCENYNGVYDGKPHGGTVEVSDANGTKVEYSLDNETWTEQAPTRTDAGYTPVYVRATNPNYTRPATAKYYINVTKADGLELTCNDQTYTYNGQPQGVGAEANKGGSTIEYSTDGGGNWSTTVPTVTNASDSTVNVSVRASNPNYKDVTGGHYTIKMNKAKADVAVTGNSETVTYDGKPHTVSGFRASCENPLYDGDKDVELAQAAKGKDTVSGTNVDEYYMGLNKDSFVNKNNNFDVNFIVIDGCLSITKADALTLSADSQEYAYDGELHSEIAEPNDSNGTTVEYSTDGEKTWSTTAPTVKDVLDGVVHVKARATNSNYSNTPTAEYTIKVKPAAITVNVEGDYQEFTYDGKEHKASGFKPTTESKLYDTNSVVLAEGAKAEVSGIDSDLYGMGLTDESFDNTDPNFDVAFNVVDGCLVINQASDLSLDVSKAGYEGAYDGQEHGGAAVPSDTRNVTVEYSTDGKTWSTDVPTVKDASEVTVQVRAESENFTLPAEATYTLKVTPAKIIVNVKGNTSTVTYNGEKQQVTGFTATTDSKLYDTKNVVLKAGCSDIAEGTDAGTYTMGLAADSFTNADDNFSVVKWNFEGDGGITIAKRPIQVSDSASVEYNGQEQVLDIDASKVTNLVDGDRLYLFGAQVKGTEPGTYAVVTDYTWDVVNDELNVTKNYDLAVVGELTITKADSGSNGSSADNGTNASSNASGDGSTTTKTADTALPFGVAFAAAAAALAALVATRKLRSSR